jgi:hypothetical protein
VLQTGFVTSLLIYSLSLSPLAVRIMHCILAATKLEKTDIVLIPVYTFYLKWFSVVFNTIWYFTTTTATATTTTTTTTIIIIIIIKQVNSSFKKKYYK